MTADTIQKSEPYSLKIESETELQHVFDLLWVKRHPDEIGNAEVIPNYRLANGNHVGAFIREYSHGFLIGLIETSDDNQFLGPVGFLVAQKEPDRLTVFTWGSAIGGYFREYEDRDYTEDKLVDEMFANNSPCNAIEVYNHQRQGLATTMFSLLVMVAEKSSLNKVEFRGCHTLPEKFVKSLGYAYTSIDRGEEVTPNYLLDLTTPR